MLNTRQVRLIAALLNEHTDKAACIAAEVPYQTFQKWIRTEEFSNALAEQRHQIMREISHRLVATASVAASKIFALLDNPNLKTELAIDLCKFVLQLSIDQHEKEGLLSRLTALEKRVSSPPDDGWNVIEGIDAKSGQLAIEN